LKREILLKSCKAAIGSATAIFIAEHVGLDYAASAGIIALITLQDTRRATLRLAARRVLSFFIAMVLAAVMGGLLGFHAAGYGCFVFFLAVLSLSRGLGSTLSTNAVFGTHLFIVGKAMTVDFFLNELAILLLGAGVAIIINAKMPGMENELRTLLEYSEHELKQILGDIAEGLPTGRTDAGKNIKGLSVTLEDGLKKSIANRDNTLREHSEFYIKYFELRKNQCAVLLGFYSSAITALDIPFAIEGISDFLKHASQYFGVENDPAPRIAQLHELLLFFKTQPLPSRRKEFEARACLFHGLKELERFFTLKQDFMYKLTQEQRQMYLDIRKVNQVGS